MGRLRMNEMIGIAGGLLLVLGVFLPWYETDPANRFARLGPLGRGAFSGYGSHQIIRWLLIGRPLRRSSSPTSSLATTSCIGRAGR